MSFVKNAILAVIAVCAVACGGAMEMEDDTGAPAPEAALATTEQGICEGYSGTSSVCTIKCTSTSGWFFVNGIPYGQCETAGYNRCGFWPYGACWSNASVAP
ncbi:hypothetical protein [Myxococcus qinghaiensis]|uniref:hypothetical protein n=1 Tax=Myxococcus qinghaiensis TaxID=2906758 RepID=UPI0020A81B77|nr:hypothetical protein [Myxococcus qinghaiensis]MCP3162271.1 hypothetical protein [Myxococcus qinghaiensis]